MDATRRQRLVILVPSMDGERSVVWLAIQHFIKNAEVESTLKMGLT